MRRAGRSAGAVTVGVVVTVTVTVGTAVAVAVTVTVSTKPRPIKNQNFVIQHSALNVSLRSISNQDLSSMTRNLEINSRNRIQNPCL